MNKNGFSLVEVIIASAILSGLMVFIFQAHQQTLDIEKRLTDSIEIAEIYEETKNLVGLACWKNLLQTIDPNKSKKEIPINAELPKLFGPGKHPILEVGKNKGSIKVQRLSYTSVPGYLDVDDEKFGRREGMIEIAIELHGRSKMSQKNTKKIQLGIIATRESSFGPPTIIACNTHQNIAINEVTKAVMAKICSLSGLEINPLTGTCSLDLKTNDSGSDVKLSPQTLQKVIQLLESRK